MRSSFDPGGITSDWTSIVFAFKRVVRYADMRNVEHHFFKRGDGNYKGDGIMITRRSGFPYGIGDARIDDPFELYSVIHRRWTAWKAAKASSFPAGR